MVDQICREEPEGSLFYPDMVDECEYFHDSVRFDDCDGAESNCEERTINFVSLSLPASWIFDSITFKP